MELHPAQRDHPKIKEWERINDEYRNTPSGWPKLPPAEASPPRFAIGEQVLCKTGNGPTDVSLGTVVKHFYGIDGEETGWPAGFWVPYQIRLHRRLGDNVELEPSPVEGDLIFTPYDIDAVIKQMPVVRPDGGVFCDEACAMEHSGSVMG